MISLDNLMDQARGLSLDALMQQAQTGHAHMFSGSRAWGGTRRGRAPKAPTSAQRLQVNAYLWGHITWDQLVSRIGLSRARQLTGEDR